MVSAPWPPSAALRLFVATELKIVFANAVSEMFGFTNTMLVVSKEVKTPDATFAAKPPPVKYLIVKVVLEGAIP